ncbi:MAG: hypothetical protein Q7K54_01390 [Candidatus Parcubacteria bacterium]|nr:hypothetical protein [Candidatus Parcubacteria bacterium]
MNLKNLSTKYQKYLPSQKFVIIIIIGLVAMASILNYFYKSSWGKEIFTSKKDTGALKIENQTIAEIIQSDLDSDGISDWEEALWGTDKNKKETFGMPDVTYIENKKKELNIEQNVNVTKLTETEKFARQFFSSFTAMNASGQVDKNTIDSFSNALGQKIVNPALVDQYSEKNVRKNTDNDNLVKQEYYVDVKSLFESYQKAGIGDELDIVNNGLAASSMASSTDPYGKLPTIAKAYQDFAKKMMGISVPSELVSYHLQIANNANNTGISVLNMAQIIKDPLIGLEGISQYQKYSAELVKTVADLEAVLTQE